LPTLTDDSWYNQSWLVAAVGAAGVLVAGVSAALILIQLRAGQRRNAFELMAELDAGVWRTRFGPDRGAKDFYALLRLVVGPIAPDEPLGQAGPVGFRPLRDRVEAVLRLDRAQFERASSIVQAYVNEVNRLAEAVEIGAIDTGWVLARWHVNLIRESYIAEPFIVVRNLRSKERWGRRVLKLAQLSRLYNDSSPRHGTPVLIRSEHLEAEAHVPAVSPVAANPLGPVQHQRLRFDKDLERWQVDLIRSFREDFRGR